MQKGPQCRGFCPRGPGVLPLSYHKDAFTNPKAPHIQLFKSFYDLTPAPLPSPRFVVGADSSNLPTGNQANMISRTQSDRDCPGRLISIKSGVIEGGLFWITEGTHSCHSGNSKSLGANCQELGTKTRSIPYSTAGCLKLLAGCMDNGLRRLRDVIWGILIGCKKWPLHMEE